MKALKWTLIILVVIVWLYILEAWYGTFYVGEYWISASFAPTLLVGAAPLWTAFLAYLLIRVIHRNV